TYHAYKQGTIPELKLTIELSDNSFLFICVIYITPNCIVCNPAVHLHAETSAADKFSEQGIGRYIFASDSNKIVEKLQQSLRLQIFFRILINSKQKRLHILFQHGQLI